MTSEERVRVGDKLRMLRGRRTQAEVAEEAGVALGTLQTIESGRRENLESNIEKVAKVYKTSLLRLRQLHEPIESDDPKLRGLKEEDLEIAHAFHHSHTEVRRRVRELVLPDEDDRMAGLVNRIATLKSSAVHELEQFVAAEEDKMRIERERKKKRRDSTDKI